MFRRGLPAALFAALALGGAYWVLRARTGPAAKSPTASTDLGSSEAERSVGVRPASLEKRAESAGESAAEQPVVRALKPAPPGEGAPAPEQPSSARAPLTPTEQAARAPEARVTSVSAERAKAPASAPKAVKPSTGKAPVAARSDSAAAASASEPRDAKTTRPNFLNRLEGQDYGGRE
jgi:hypothetical protein